MGVDGSLTTPADPPVPRFTPPAPLLASHDVGGFESGHPELDSWLRERAHAAEGRTARSYVTTNADSPAAAVVLGYYTLNAAAILRERLSTAKLRKGMPSEIPSVLIGRLAIDRRVQERGIGSALLADGLRRVIGISRQLGVRAVIVHPIDDRAARFYRGFGFVEALDGRSMLLPLESAIRALGT